MHDDNIVKLKCLATELVEFANFASEESVDDRCLILYGLTKDCGYKILAEAEREWKYHAMQKQRRGFDHQGPQGKDKI